MSKVTLHMVSSLDGFIAKPDDSVEWMHSKDTFENGTELTEEYITNFLKSIDCYVMGSKTYEHAVNLGWPYGDTPVIVLTSRSFSSEKVSVQFVNGDLKQLFKDQLANSFKNIWVVGGAHVTKQMIQEELADELVVTIVPILLGNGTLFFDHVNKEVNLHLLDVTAYKDGMVEMTYQLKRSEKQ